MAWQPTHQSVKSLQHMRHNKRIVLQSITIESRQVVHCGSKTNDRIQQHPTEGAHTFIQAEAKGV